MQVTLRSWILSTAMLVGICEGDASPTADGAFLQPAGSTMLDSRDGQHYPLVSIAGRTWLARNLNFQSGDSRCYDDNPARCAEFGRLYSWQAAQTACPAGFHLPSEEEWLALARSTGGYYELAERRAVGDPTRSYLALLTGGPTGFNGLLGGSGGSAGGSYADLNEDGMYSTSSKCGADGVVYIVFNGKYRRVLRDCWTRQLAVSVRCVQGS